MEELGLSSLEEKLEDEKEAVEVYKDWSSDFLQHYKGACYFDLIFSKFYISILIDLISRMEAEWKIIL